MDPLEGPWETAHLRDKAASKGRKAEAAAGDIEHVNMYKGVFKSEVRNIKIDICWSVACAETVEGHYNVGKEETEKYSLSPQFLLDHVVVGIHSRNKVSNFKKATKLMTDKGLPTDDKYPFIGRPKERIPEHLHGVRFKVHGAKEETVVTGEDEVKRLLDTGKGPILAVFDIDGHFSVLQRGEIYKGPGTRPPEKQDLHAVVIIGYGKSGEENFWNVRNCYGPGWCEDGYGRVSTGIKLERIWYPLEVRKTS